MKELLHGKSGTGLIGLGIIASVVLVGCALWIVTVQRMEAACNAPGYGIYDIVPDGAASVDDSTPCGNQTINFTGKWKYTGAKTGGGDLEWSEGKSLVASDFTVGTHVNTGSYYETDVFGHKCGFKVDVEFTVTKCCCPGCSIFEDDPNTWGERKRLKPAKAKGDCGGVHGDTWPDVSVKDSCGTVVTLRCNGIYVELTVQVAGGEEIPIGHCPYISSGYSAYVYWGANGCHINSAEFIVEEHFPKGAPPCPAPTPFTPCDCGGNGLYNSKYDVWRCDKGPQEQICYVASELGLPLYRRTIVECTPGISCDNLK